MLLAAWESLFLPKRRTLITKTFLVMRLTTILMLATCLHLSAKTQAQQINLSEQKISLDKVFKKITDQTGYLFVYRDEWLKQTRDVTISVHGASLKEVLDICFKDQPFTYVIIDKMVVLKEKPVPPVPAAEEPQQQEVLVRGHVADSVNGALADASVRIKGTTKGTQADIHGDFELKNIPEGTVLVISYTGYISKEITVSAKGSNYHYVMLQRSQDALDATVIQAYGSTSRRFNIGSISTVDASTIESQPVTNPLLALQGQVPGLVVNTTGGVPGSQVLIQVRGQNTLRSNLSTQYTPYDQPLFIIDGVPFAPQNNNVSQLQSVAIAGAYSGGLNVPGGLSAFNSINPNDIESISVLKDADATSIYGSQGSNGVVLITTKKGKPGKTIFNLAAATGVNTSVDLIKLMNVQEYRQMRLAAFAADGVTPNPSAPFYLPSYAPDLTIFDSTRNVDWDHVIFGKSSNSTDIHGTLSGGAINNTFLLSGGYTRSDFNYPGHFYDQRFTLHSQLHHSSSDGHLVVEFGTDYSYDQNISGAWGGSSKVLLAPNTPLLDSAGSLQWIYKGVSLAGYQFYAFLQEPTNANTYNLNNSLHLVYKIINGLSVGVNMGYSRTTTDENQAYPAAAQNPAYSPTGSANFGNNVFQTLNVEPQLDYQYVKGKNMITALVGGTYKKSLNTSTVTSGYGYSNDDLLGSINGAGTVYASDNSALYRYSAGFARVKYIYDQQYIVSLTGRRDGSSNFGPGRQFGNFGSAGAGWIFSEQKAFKSLLPFVSYGKLAANYGTTGSDGIAPYQYQSIWKPQGSGTPAFQGLQPSAPQNLYNPDYSWALKKSLNASLDMGFFHDRVLLNATFYRNREGNQLAGYPLPSQAGMTQVLENTPGVVQNKGWEFTFSSTNIKTKNFSWTSNFNLTFNRNKLLSFPNLENSSYAETYMIGKPTSLVIGYKYKDVNPTSGLFEFYDHTGKVTGKPVFSLPSKGGDLVPAGDREVKYMGGFGNTFTYKHLSLYLFIQFASQDAPNYLYGIYSAGLPGQGVVNMPTAAGNYWKKPGDNTPLERLTAGSYSDPAISAAYGFLTSSGAYGVDTYARLKTASLSYTLPQSVVRKMHIQEWRWYVNGQNLLTFTNYKVTDPEQFGNLTSFPLQRTVVIGLSFNF